MEPKHTRYLDTLYVHAGTPPKRENGALVNPIYESATYAYGDEVSYYASVYGRLSNTPTHKALHQKLAELEGAEDALVFSSGMAAITTSLLTVLKPGDHLLLQDCLYGGTKAFVLEEFRRLGIHYDFFSLDDPQWQEKLKPNTKAIYVETLSNPLNEIPDLGEILHFAKTNQIVSMIDNTFASPQNFQASKFGFDLVLHSATKYLNGHSDLCAGVVTGSEEWIKNIHHKQSHFGGSLDSLPCFLLERGIKTLGIRVRQANENAIAIADFLQQHPQVESVNYPALEAHKHFMRARQYLNGCGGIVSFYLKGNKEKAMKAARKTKVFLHAPSLGGIESLIVHPAGTIMSEVPKKERDRIGVTDSLIRLAVGIEKTEDLIDDLEQALS